MLPKKRVKYLYVAMKKGDREAFEALYKLFYERLSKYILSISKNTVEAEDIAQETLIWLWESRKDITINSSLNAYLYRSARNRYMDLYRKKERRSKLIEEIRQDIIIYIENSDAVEKELRLKQLYAAIEELPEKCKEIFILSKLKRYKQKDIAIQLNISQRTVESQIRNGLLAIRSKLDIN
ncbi:RNA polymerase sigma factor [Flavivirga eckloniae]|uniref:RNA polymerase sigma-70 factor n=1 Tax=Flavivirga eckloniae TaxID=1803846 RepID=A0A2K9PLJ7_9FLAO|nr:RNA polymerase sigma-70 factor [Flavivirga eckloniae]AUP77930.1 RNA polymerase sigma-70 factor [Flavivirga eckloniae]